MAMAMVVLVKGSLMERVELPELRLLVIYICSYRFTPHVNLQVVIGYRQSLIYRLITIITTTSVHPPNFRPCPPDLTTAGPPNPR